MAKKHLKFYRTFLLFFFVIIASQLQAQLMNHYWSQSYNSISSLLSGAVVAGDAGNAAIYYNPANIVEIEKGSNISLAASFLTLNHYTVQNAMGDDINLKSTGFYVQPQFFSVGVNSPFNKMSFEIATFNRVKEQMVFDYAESHIVNIDDFSNAQNRLTTQVYYKNYYSDDWIGFGGAYSVNEHFHLGISINVSFATLSYINQVSMQVYPLVVDTLESGDENSGLMAENEYIERMDFTKVRMISRIGSAYESGNWRFGLNISLPPINILTLGKKALRSQKEIYSFEEVSNTELVDYFIFDAQSGTDIKANYKLPFSIAFGALYKLGNNKKVYSTIEYFAGLTPYKMIDAPLNTNITTDLIYDKMQNKEWLSYAYGAVPVLNIAIGYSWQVKPKVLFLMGLRTDFNNIKDYDYGHLDNYAKLSNSTLNIYHATGGVKFQFKKHQLIAGTQISFGMEKNGRQIANFGPEYKPDYGSQLPLLGTREDVSTIYNFSISLFLGATLNFESKKQNPDKN